MDRHLGIVLAASALIAAPFAYAALNIAALGEISVRTPGYEQFAFFESSNSGAAQVCNPTIFYASLEGLHITVYYQGDSKGTYAFGPALVPPKGMALVYGVFRSESYAESQYTFMHMDGQFAGNIPTRLDPGKMEVLIEARTAIMGIIPYTTSERQGAFEFWRASNCYV